MGDTKLIAVSGLYTGLTGIISVLFILYIKRHNGNSASYFKKSELKIQNTIYTLFNLGFFDLPAAPVTPPAIFIYTFSF